MRTSHELLMVVWTIDDLIADVDRDKADLPSVRQAREIRDALIRRYRVALRVEGRRTTRNQLDAGIAALQRAQNPAGTRPAPMLTSEEQPQDGLL